MLKISLSTQFKKDMKKAKARGLPQDEMKVVVDKIAGGQPLEEKYCDHPLFGKLDLFRECHIRPDWLLIYRILLKEQMLFLFRTGTHSDLY